MLPRQAIPFSVLMWYSTLLVPVVLLLFPSLCLAHSNPAAGSYDNAHEHGNPSSLHNHDIEHPTQSPPPHLISGAERLAFSGSPIKYARRLGLHVDGTAYGDLNGSSTWIYHTTSGLCLAGKPPTAPRGFDESIISAMQMAMDRSPAHDQFDHAFEQVVKEHAKTIYVDFGWIDCGAGPDGVLCVDDLPTGEEEQRHGPTLVYMNFTTPCTYDAAHKHRFRCTAISAQIRLPLRRRMPWTRRVRVFLSDESGKSVVVPAFPSAEEQMRSVVLQDGAVEGLDPDFREWQGWKEWRAVRWDGVRPCEDGGVEYLKGPEEVMRRAGSGRCNQ